MRKFIYFLSFTSLTFSFFSCSNDDDTITSNGIETVEKFSKIIQVSNEERNTSVDLRLTSYDQTKLDAFLDSYEYVLTKESVLKSTDTIALEQEFTSENVITTSFSSIENEVISDLPAGYLITLQERTPILRYGISGTVTSISLRKMVGRSTYYYWSGVRYLASSSYFGWVGHPQNGRRTYKTASFDSSIFRQWSIQ